jgi:hypothetical protein
MKKIIVYSFLVIALTGAVRAQTIFLLKDASKHYDVKISVSKCEEDTCEGAGKIELFKKNAAAIYQTIEMPNVFIELGSDRKPTANLIELYGENNSGIVFDDYNFDGAEDIAVRNGNEGGYGGPSYDIFLFSGPRKFIRNASLTKLASENLGLFAVDKKKKTIETFDKSGCCWHRTIRYRVIKNRPVKIYEMVEDAFGSDGKVRITTKRLIKGRWRTTTRVIAEKDR